MELHVGDRVFCHLPIDGNSSIVGLEGTVIGLIPDRNSRGGVVPVLEFDSPIAKGHSGGDRGSARGQPGHCWNAWGWRPDDGSLSLVGQCTAEERTRKAVLNKIKYLEQKFEQRQKEKKNASTLASVQKGFIICDELSEVIRTSSTPSRDIWSSIEQIRFSSQRW